MRIQTREAGEMKVARTIEASGVQQRVSSKSNSRLHISRERERERHVSSRGADVRRIYGEPWVVQEVNLINKFRFSTRASISAR